MLRPRRSTRHGDSCLQVVSPEEVSRSRVQREVALTIEVSRTVTAPFDRLKVYLITTDKVFTSAATAPGKAAATSMLASPTWAAQNLGGAMLRIYRDGGGVRAFWVGNGLNVTKIFPVSCAASN